MIYFEMEGYKEDDRVYPSVTVRRSTFKEAIRELSRFAGGLLHYSRVVVYYVGEVDNKAVKLYKWNFKASALGDFVLLNCPFLE